MKTMSQGIAAGLILATLAAGAQADAVRVWNPYYREPAMQRASIADHEAAALRQANLRRTQIGLPALTLNAQIAAAAAGHSAYLATNNLTGHYQSASQYPAGFTGTTAGDRLDAAGYHWRLYGEVISFGPATGATGVESLIEAIYHRFGLFDPGADEAGAGFVGNHPAYDNVLTINLGNQQVPATGSPAGWVGMYPYDGQTGVQIDFFSDTESPDPVAGANRVGYPVSIHIGYGKRLSVSSFTLETASGASEPVTLLSAATDSHVPIFAAAIVPLSPLTPGQTYRASFSGSADGAPMTQSWQFTAAPQAAVSFSPANPCVTVGATRNIFIIGDTATNVSYGSAVSVKFVAADQLAVTGVAAGTATITVTTANNGTASTTVTIGLACSPSAASSSDRIFNWAEANFRHLLESPGATSQSLGGYYYRYYPTTQTYVGTKDGTVWYLDGYTGALLDVGSVEAILQMADDAGY
jgi:uncharacterized protein YkwD